MVLPCPRMVPLTAWSNFRPIGQRPSTLAFERDFVRYERLSALGGGCAAQGGIMADGRFAGRVAVITGGASGIGKATAELFVKEGANVVIGDLESSAGAKVAEKIGGTFVATDVRESKQVEALVKAATDKHGRLDAMFNN